MQSLRPEDGRMHRGSILMATIVCQKRTWMTNRETNILKNRSVTYDEHGCWGSDLVYIKWIFSSSSRWSKGSLRLSSSTMAHTQQGYFHGMYMYTYLLTKPFAPGPPCCFILFCILWHGAVGRTGHRNGLYVLAIYWVGSKQTRADSRGTPIPSAYYLRK